MRIGEDQAKDYLNKLEVSSSAWPDEIHLRLLKELSKVISEPISDHLWELMEDTWGPRKLGKGKHSTYA